MENFVACERANQKKTRFFLFHFFFFGEGEGFFCRSMLTNQQYYHILETWVKECEIKSRQHRKYHLVLLVVHACLFLPVNLIPLAILLVDPEVADLPGVLFPVVLLGSACDVLLNTLGLVPLAVDHKHFSRRYAMLARELQFEAARGQHNAEEAGMVLQRCIEQWHQLEMLAPATL